MMRARRLFAAVLAAIVLLAGCGGGGPLVEHPHGAAAALGEARQARKSAELAFRLAHEAFDEGRIGASRILLKAARRQVIAFRHAIARYENKTPP
jgi:predicted small lipoprotein YifL